MSAFTKTIDTKILGRKTYEASLRLGAKFDSNNRTLVFSRHAPPPDVPQGVEFVNGSIGPFVNRLREQPRQNVWLMTIDEFVINVEPYRLTPFSKSPTTWP
ncbi:MAG TPA: hypothetical protein VLA89_12940 [Gemmatimonadales bacterium]|nr:hypothetical protein [Gemmatimonadales bacterium]